MAQSCPRCGSASDDDATSCSACGQHLLEPIRPGDLIGGRYEIVRRLGQGAMGAVFSAHDQVLDERVALKFLHFDLAHSASLERRFRTEIKLARKIVHRNVCRIYEYGEDRGRRFISMELIEGTDLKGVLSREGYLPERRTVLLSIQIADGLEAIHQTGVVHRDLKTSNVMVDKAGTVRLMDFGIAKDLLSDAHVDKTATGLVVGTPHYMSPEQGRGDRVDPRSDVYALGVVMFEMLTGRLLFEGDTPMAVILKHINDRPPLTGPAAARLPPSLVPILEKALAKSRDDRFQSASQLSAALRKIAGTAADDPARYEAARTLERSAPTSAFGQPPPANGGALAAQATVPLTPDPSQRTPVMAPTLTRQAPAPARPSAELATRVGARPRRRGLALGALAAAGLVVASAGAAIAVRARWPHVEGTGVVSTPSPAVTPLAATLPAVSARPVSVNALPWARVAIRPRGGAGDWPAGELTPCVLTLPPGRYEVRLENGGVTPELIREIEIAADRPPDFVFVMPTFEPRTAAQQAVSRLLR